MYYSLHPMNLKIYRFYNWRVEKKDSTPMATLVFVMTSVHYFQVMVLLTILGKFFPMIYNMYSFSKLSIILIAFGSCGIYYFLIRKMSLFTDTSYNEFKNETKEQRRRGSIYILLFTVGSVIAFFISLPLIFGFGR